MAKLFDICRFQNAFVPCRKAVVMTIVAVPVRMATKFNEILMRWIFVATTLLSQDCFACLLMQRIKIVRAVGISGEFSYTSAVKYTSFWNEAP